MRPQIVTVAPSAARRAARARPMPVPPPVTRPACPSAAGQHAAAAHDALEALRRVARLTNSTRLGQPSIFEKRRSTYSSVAKMSTKDAT